MNAGQLITILRQDYLDDMIKDYMFTDNTLLRYLSEAQRQACNRINLIYDPTFTLTLVQGVRFYTINPKITYITDVHINNVPLCKTTESLLYKQFPDWNSYEGITTKIPLYYYIKGRQLILHVTPTASDSGTIVHIKAYRLPLLDLTSVSSEPEIPEEFHRDLIWYALHEAVSRGNYLGDKTRAVEFMQKFELAFGYYISAKIRQREFELPTTQRFSPL